MAVDRLGEPDAAHLGARFQDGLSSLDLQVLNHDHGITVGQHVPYRITHFAAGSSGFGFLRRTPLVPAQRTDEHLFKLIRVLTRTLGTDSVAHAAEHSPEPAGTRIPAFRRPARLQSGLNGSEPCGKRD